MVILVLDLVSSGVWLGLIVGLDMVVSASILSVRVAFRVKLCFRV